MRLVRAYVDVDRAHDAIDLRSLANELPGIAFERGRDIAAIAIDLDGWDGGFDPFAIDSRMPPLEAEGSFDVALHARTCTGAARALGVLTRYQRYGDRRNRASRGASFDEVLARHRALHALEKPLVRADFDHAIDVWQWTLRLDPDASHAVQIAALFHDVERLSSEADRRVEHLAADYRSFKEAHARIGGEIVREVLRGIVDDETRSRVGALVVAHEHPDRDPDLSLLNDADALSFFSLNSPGYFRYFGVEQTRAKVAYSLARMSAAARARLPLLALIAPIREALDRAIAAEVWA